MSKTVLIVTPTFVPDNRGRAARLRARIKYLVADHDWIAVVQVTDETPVRRVVSIDGNECVVYRDLQRKSRRDDAERGSFLPESIRKMIGSSLFPDVHAVSLPAAFRAARRIICSEGVDIVYTMCYPFSHHLLGYALAKTTDVAWLAEFRDPWVTNPNHFDGEAGLLHKRLERTVVNAADRVVYNYGIQVPEDYFARSYPDQKVTQLNCPGSCGFDFDRLGERSPPADRFRIVYGGTFYGDNHTPIPFLKGLRNFLDESEADVVVDFYGDWEPSYEEVVDRLALSPVVTSHGWIDPDEFLTQLQQSHVSLFIVRQSPGDELNVPQKIVEYIAAGTALLVLAPSDWESAKYTLNNGVGVRADPNDPEAIADALDRLYATYRDDGLDAFTASEEFLNTIDARTQTEVFAEALNSALQVSRS